MASSWRRSRPRPRTSRYFASLTTTRDRTDRSRNLLESRGAAASADQELAIDKNRWSALDAFIFRFFGLVANKLRVLSAVEALIELGLVNANLARPGPQRIDAVIHAKQSLALVDQ